MVNTHAALHASQAPALSLPPAELPLTLSPPQAHFISLLSEGFV